VLADFVAFFTGSQQRLSCCHFTWEQQHNAASLACMLDDIRMPCGVRSQHMPRRQIVQKHRWLEPLLMQGLCTC
jgi:hypothetical protein